MLACVHSEILKVPNLFHYTFYCIIYSLRNTQQFKNVARKYEEGKKPNVNYRDEGEKKELICFG